MEGETQEEVATEAAPTFRELGNAAFQNGRYLQAIELYTSAIEVGPPTAALFSNRAAAHLKCESYGSALSDANMALKLDPKFVKAYYRRGSTLLAMSRPMDAKQDFQKLAKFDPKNKDVAAQLRECDTMIRAKLEEAYRRVEEDAGVGGGGASASHLPSYLTPESIPVPGDYKGPVLPRIPAPGTAASAEACAEDPTAVNVHGISLGFVRALKSEFKSQKLLAKRFAWELLIRVRNILTEYLSLVRINFPAEAPTFNVCGDTHGQYYDTCNIFENITGEPSPTNPCSCQSVLLALLQRTHARSHTFTHTHTHNASFTKRFVQWRLLRQGVLGGGKRAASVCVEAPLPRSRSSHPRQP